MVATLRTVGRAVWLIVVVGLVFAVPFVFFKGAIWVSEHLLGYLIAASWVVLFIDVLILLPLSLFRRMRGHTGHLIYLSSYLFGLVTWLVGFILTYTLWGGWGVILGLMSFGIGVVFMAMFATMFKGMWAMLATVIGLAVVTYGSRLVGALVAER